MKKECKRLVPIGICVFLLYLCIHYWPTVETVAGKLFHAVSSLLLGCVMAYLMNILMSFYERHYFPKSQRKLAIKSRRPVCLVGAALTLVAILAFVVGLVMPELVACVQTLIEQIPAGLAMLEQNTSISALIPEDWAARLQAMDWQKIITQGAELVASGVSGIFSVVTSTVSAIASGFIGLIFSFYLLAGKDRIKGQCHRLLRSYVPAPKRARLRRIWVVFDDSFRRYIVGQCLEAVILGVLCALGMMIFRFPYAGMIGALVGVTALVPIAGAYIGAGVGAIMILTVSPIKALLFLVFIVVLQQLEGDLIYPRVVGSSIGLPGIWVLAAVTVGGGLWGIPGMMVGVPAAAAIYRLLREDVTRREAKAARTRQEPAPEQDTAASGTD